MSLDLDKCQVCGKPLGMDQVSHCSSECLLIDIKQRQEKAAKLNVSPGLFQQFLGRLRATGKRVEIARPLQAICFKCGHEHTAYGIDNLTCNVVRWPANPYINPPRPPGLCGGLLIFDEAY